jgi:GTPase involved in cell partitioning and DNA repair
MNGSNTKNNDEATYAFVSSEAGKYEHNIKKHNQLLIYKKFQNIHRKYQHKFMLVSRYRVKIIVLNRKTITITCMNERL